MRMAEARERHLEGIERAGADIAEHDAKRGQRQKPRTSRMMDEFGRDRQRRMRQRWKSRPERVTRAQRGLGSDRP